MEDTDKARAALYAGALLGFMAFIGASLGLEPARSQLAGLSAWACLLLASAISVYVTGASLLTHRPWKFTRAVLWSALLAALAEVFNLRLGLWQYLDQPATLSVRWSGWLLLWSSWLPCLLATEDLLAALKLTRNLKYRPLKLAASAPAWLAGVGGLFLLLALSWPPRFWFLAALAPLLLTEALNLRLALPSIFRELLGGIPWRAVSLGLAGLLLGALRQAVNALSGSPLEYSGVLSGSHAIWGLSPLLYPAFPVLALTSYSFYCLAEGLQKKTAALKPAIPAGERFAFLYMPSLLPALAIVIIYFSLRATDSGSVSRFLGWI